MAVFVPLPRLVPPNAACAAAKAAEAGRVDAEDDEPTAYTLEFGGVDGEIRPGFFFEIFGGLSFGALSFGSLSFGGLSFGGLSLGGLSLADLSFGGLPMPEISLLIARKMRDPKSLSLPSLLLPSLGLLLSPNGAVTVDGAEAFGLVGVVFKRAKAGELGPGELANGVIVGGSMCRSPARASWLSVPA